MSGETRRASRSEDRSREKKIKNLRRSNSASSETRSRSRNPSNKDKRSRSSRQKRNRSSSHSVDGSSASSLERKRLDRDVGGRNRDFRNGARGGYQDNSNRGGAGIGGAFRKRRLSPGQVNWQREQYEKRKQQMSSRGHFQQPRFDNRQDRFKNNSFNRFRDRNWKNNNRQNYRYNDNRNRDRFQDRNNDRGRRNNRGPLNEELPQEGPLKNSKDSRDTHSWSMESPERKRDKGVSEKMEESVARSISPEVTRNRSTSPAKKKKDKLNRSRSSSTSSSSSDSSTSSSSSSSSSNSSSSSSSSSSSDRDKKRKKKKKLSKKAKKAEKKRKEKKKKLKKKQKKKMLKAKDKKSSKKDDEEKKSSKDRLIKDIPTEIVEKSKSMAPMTKEEWDKRQNVIRRVYDEESGRHRLIKGDGEVLEEIVTKERHKEINRQATRGDGEYFQSRLRTNK